MDERLLSRVEDAGLNASAPPQQRWLDGWLLRASPGKAKRARCINAVADGRLPLEQRLQLAQQFYDEAGLPMLVRITPYTRPTGLDAWLEARGYTTLDDTRVMVCTQLPTADPAQLPAGLACVPLAARDFADAVGELRGSTAELRQAHAERLVVSPVRYSGYALRRVDDGTVVACAQIASEAELVGLYDVQTRPQDRGRGLASLLCERLLFEAAKNGAHIAYLQVEADNAVARRIYGRLGFADGYAYHYLLTPGLRG